MSAACCACSNRATSAVTRRGCCSARWWPSWRWRWPGSGAREACDEPADPGSDHAAGGIPGVADHSAALPAEQPGVGAGGVAGHVRAIVDSALAVRPQRRGRPVYGEHPLDPDAGDSFPCGGRWDQLVAGAAIHFSDAHLRADLLEARAGPGEGILRVPAAAGIRPGGRVHRAGSLPVLRVLGSLPGSDVFPDLLEARAGPGEGILRVPAAAGTRKIPS